MKCDIDKTALGIPQLVKHGYIVWVSMYKGEPQVIFVIIPDYNEKPKLEVKD